MNFKKTCILAAFILVTVPFNADASCDYSEPDEEPYMPCGYFEDYYEMEHSRKKIKIYLGGLEAYMQCLSVCINEANAKAENIIHEWDTAVREFSYRQK